MIVVEPAPSYSSRTKSPGWRFWEPAKSPSLLERRRPPADRSYLSLRGKLPCGDEDNNDNASIPVPAGRTTKAVVVVVADERPPKTSKKNTKQQKRARAPPSKIGTAISVARYLERKGPEKLREFYAKRNSCFCCETIFPKDHDDNENKKNKQLLKCQCFSSSSCRGAIFCVKCAKERGFAGTCHGCQSFLCGNCHFLGWVKGRESRLLCDLCCAKKGESLIENMW
jgi:hypothetical protein